MGLVRRYVGKRLSEYYAQPSERVVGRSSRLDDTNLSSLLGAWHWQRLFQKAYDEREGHWLTPVELFRPHYSNILAEFVVHAIGYDEDLTASPSSSSSSHPVEIIELGGGRGTNATLMLSYLRKEYPDLYSNLTYKLIDSSPTLHKLQMETLSKGGHAGKVKFELKDLMDVAEKRVQLIPKSDIPTVVFGLELLDNLPHDKIRARSGRTLEQAEIRETKSKHRKDLSSTNQEKQRHRLLTNEEVFVPLSDPLLSSVVKSVPSYVQPYPAWIPTVACGVIDHISKQRPNSSLVFADFDWLPAPDIPDTSINEEIASSSTNDNDDNDDDDDDKHLTLSSSQPQPGERFSAWAEGEPIVTNMDGIDYECYLNSPGFCDILFPTDFNRLASFVKRRNKGKDDSQKVVVTVEKQSEFLERYGSDHVEATKSWLTGHTPLLYDFSNCSVITVTNKSRRRPKKTIT